MEVDFEEQEEEEDHEGEEDVLACVPLEEVLGLSQRESDFFFNALVVLFDFDLSPVDLKPPLLDRYRRVVVALSRAQACFRHHGHYLHTQTHTHTHANIVSTFDTSAKNWYPPPRADGELLVGFRRRGVVLELQTR